MKHDAQVAPAPAWHRAVLALLAAAPVACALLTSTASSDTNRDLYFAEQIARGASFPLLGPNISEMLYLGPLWYYVLAVPLLLVRNAAAATALMGLLFAMQFPLAHALGRRIGSPRLGLLFALALAIPGWMLVSLVSLTHTVLVAPGLLLAALATLAYRERPGAGRAICLGLSGVVMLTAHPTLVFPAAILFACALARDRDWRRWIAHGLIVGALPLLALAPALYAQWHGDAANIVATQHYATTDWSLPSPAAGFRLVHAALVFGPKYIAHFLMDLPRRPAQLLVAIYALVVLAAAAGLVVRFVRDPRTRALVIALPAMLLAQAMFLAAVRKPMPPWMVYQLWPTAAALLALGLDAICERAALGRAFAAAGLGATTLWMLAACAVIARAPLDQVDMRPSPGKRGLMDVRDYEKSELRYRIPRLPFRDVFAIGEPLCEPVTLYAHYAWFVDTTFAAGALAECGTTANIEIGGAARDGRSKWIGLHASVWQRLAMQPARRIGALGLSVPVAVWHGGTPFVPIAPTIRNFSRDLRETPRRFVVRGEAPAGYAIVVAHRAHRYAPFAVAGARIDGVPIEPRYVDAMTVIFRDASAGAEPGALRRWEIDIDAAPDYVDVLTVSSSE